MSTVSDVASIAPSRETTASLREKYRDRILPAPFTELPFDVYVIADPLVPDKENLHYFCIYSEIWTTAVR